MIIYRFIYKEYAFQGNLVWNPLQNFHDDRPIIQGRNMNLDIKIRFIFIGHKCFLIFLLTYTDGCRANAMLRALRGIRQFDQNILQAS